MDGRILLAYALIAVLGASGIWLTARFLKRRRAFKIRQKGRK